MMCPEDFDRTCGAGSCIKVGVNTCTWTCPTCDSTQIALYADEVCEDCGQNVQLYVDEKPRKKFTVNEIISAGTTELSE
jgi:hypothetical protein